LADSDLSWSPPESMRQLTGITSTTFGLPVPPLIIIVILLAILLWLFLTRTATGRRLYATGTNVRAAGLTGIRTGAMWTWVFAMSGISAGLGGVLLASLSSCWSAAIVGPYLYTRLAAVLLGCTTLGSIRGRYTRTVLGAL